MSVTPETPAKFKGGKSTLIQYLKKKSFKMTSEIEKEKIQPCRIYFTVTASGKVSGVKLDASSGYREIDRSLVKLVKTYLRSGHLQKM